MTTSRETTWYRSPEDRASGTPHDSPEFPHPVPADKGVDRRAFLRLVGFSFAAAGVTACSRGPVQTVLTDLVAQDGIVPGRAYWIATTSWADGSGAGVLVRCRDGRPVKLEGNPDHPLNKGGLTASVQASVLSLYDDHRLDGPLLDGQSATWANVDEAMRARLAGLTTAGGTVRLLTSTVTGPSTQAWIDRFLASVPDSRHVSYDALSCSALLDAHEEAYGERAVPRYDLAAARVLAVFDADPLGTWISPAEYSAGYAVARKPEAAAGHGAEPGHAMSRHWQFEGRMSLTGTRADRRVRMAPWETTPALAWLAAAIADHAGVDLPGPAPDGSVLRPILREALDELAAEMWSQHQHSLLLCGTNDRDAQRLTCWINNLLDNAGRTRHLNAPSQQRLGSDADVEALRKELLAGDVDLLITAGCNPVYDLPGFADAVSAASVHVSFASLTDETSMRAAIVCPEPHELERWDDAEPLAGLLCTTQPTLPPLRDTRTLRASLARWTGDDREDRALMKDYWRTELDGRRTSHDEPFDIWFDRVLERGFVQLPPTNSTAADSFDGAAMTGAFQRAAGSVDAPAGGTLRAVLFPSIAILDGRGAQNPWLQELPDPVAKTTWDNHASLSPATAEQLGLADGDVVSMTATIGEGAAESERPTLELPVLVQPGQDDGIVAIALGYGRLGTDRFTDIGPQWIEAVPTVAPGGTVGVNVAPWLSFANGTFAPDALDVRLNPTGEHRQPACTQDHHSLTVPGHLAPPRGAIRDAVHLITVGELHDGSDHAAGEGHGAPTELWADDHKPRGHQWGMAIDLTSCTGCSACVIGCQAENNVPVVGRDEVRRHREMSWLRIDRYYADRSDLGPGVVDVVHQPMLCQHCAHAPCETVCPVLATMHSNEGLNTQVYNRCVGTRYCANNCPYKVRRFNWFEYSQPDRMENMVLNPDVTIRSRGIMEKCSMCLQRIQQSKAEARRQGIPLKDGDIQTACQQSCPTQAIVFGDLMDPESRVSKKVAAQRAYTVLEELNVKPGIRYLADVRNRLGEEG